MSKNKLQKTAPRPWEVFVSNNRGKAVQISIPLDANARAGEYIATCMGENRGSNAELIVRAVNTHDELLSVLERALREAGPHMSNGLINEIEAVLLKGGVK